MSKQPANKKTKVFKAEKFLKDHQVDLSTVTAADLVALMDAELAAGHLTYSQYYDVAKFANNERRIKYELLRFMRRSLDTMGKPVEVVARRHYNLLKVCSPFPFYDTIHIYLERIGKEDAE